MHTSLLLPVRPANFAVTGQPSDADSTTDKANTEAKKQALAPRTEKVPLLVIEDHASLVDGMRSELAKEYAVSVVSTMEELVSELAQKSFGLAIVDLTFDGKLEGLAMMPLLHAAGIKFLVFSGTDEDWPILTAIRFGALGYVNKRKRLFVLSRALRAIANGSKAFPPDILKKMHKQKDFQFPTLGPAETEVMDILMTKVDPEDEGIPSNKFIMKEMNVSLNRVEGIFRRLFTKFEIKDSSRTLLRAKLKAVGYYPGVPLTPFAELDIKL